jgi:hypothetical protein
MLYAEICPKVRRHKCTPQITVRESARSTKQLFEIGALLHVEPITSYFPQHVEAITSYFPHISSV